ncbi:MAG: hypothetical protein ACI9FN_002404 [Saprospiraceae bacterium]|jgi:hypothetical protein
MIDSYIGRLSILIPFLFCWNFCSSAQSSASFEELKSKVYIAKEVLDRNLLDTLSAEIIALCESENSEEILHYGLYI